MEREQSPKIKEHELHPAARAWMGMEQVDPRTSYNRCLIASGNRGKTTITFRGLGLKEVVFEDQDVNTPVMTEHLVPVSAPACLDTRVFGYNLRDESQWLTHRPDEPVKLDKPYRTLYPELNSLDE